MTSAFSLQALLGAEKREPEGCRACISVPGEGSGVCRGTGTPVHAVLTKSSELGALAAV